MKKIRKAFLVSFATLVFGLFLTSCESSDDGPEDLFLASYLLTQAPASEPEETTELNIPDAVLTETQGVSGSVSAVSTSASAAAGTAASTATGGVVKSAMGRSMREFKSKLVNHVIKSASIATRATADVEETPFQVTDLSTSVSCQSGSGTLTGSITNGKVSGSKSDDADNPYNEIYNISYDLEITATYVNCTLTATDLSDQSQLTGLGYTDEMPTVTVELDGTLNLEGSAVESLTLKNTYDEAAFTADTYGIKQESSSFHVTSGNDFQIDNGSTISIDINQSQSYKHELDALLTFASLDDLNEYRTSHSLAPESVSGSASITITVDFSGMVSGEEVSGTIIRNATTTQSELNMVFGISDASSSCLALPSNWTEKMSDTITASSTCSVEGLTYTCEFSCPSTNLGCSEGETFQSITEYTSLAAAKAGPISNPFLNLYLPVRGIIRASNVRNDMWDTDITFTLNDGYEVTAASDSNYAFTFGEHDSHGNPGSVSATSETLDDFNSSDFTYTYSTDGTLQQAIIPWMAESAVTITIDFEDNAVSSITNYDDTVYEISHSGSVEMCE